MPPDNDSKQSLESKARSSYLRLAMTDAAELYKHSITSMLGHDVSNGVACLSAIQEGLRERIAQTNALDAAGLREDLTAQCALLNVLTLYALEQARAAGSPASKDVYFRLLLRAQQAYARTAATLAGLMLAERQAPVRLSNDG